MKSCPFYPNQIVLIDVLGWARIRSVIPASEDTDLVVIGTLYRDNSRHDLSGKHCRPATIGVRVYRRPSKGSCPRWQWLGTTEPLWFAALSNAIEYAKKAACNRRNYQVKVAALEPETQSIFTLTHIKL